MSLNITFTCNANNIVDENENPVDCNYKAYYVRQGIWNDTRTSDQQQFNFNAGDADSLSQTGELKNNDVVIICLWQDTLDGGNTSLEVSGNKTRFTTFAIVHDGSTTQYIINPQLKPKMVPTCNWNFDLTQTINETYTATPLSDDEDSWEYEGHTFYHRRTYYSTLIFDSVGNIIDTYDYNNDGTFVSDPTNTYTDIYDIVATHKAVNSYDLESTCDKTIRTFYHVPLPDIIFTPDMVITDVYYGQNLQVDFEVFDRDEDDRATTIDTELRYIALNNSVISTDNVTSDNTVDVTSNKVIDILSRVTAHMTIHWNDGWDDLSFTRNETRIVENTLPETNLFMTNLTARNKRFSHISTDVDGSIVYANYKIYLLMPFGAGWTLVQEVTNTGAQLLDPVEVTFAQNGTYKTVLNIRDNANTLIPASYGTDSDEIEFDIAIDTCTAESYEAAKVEEIFFIFPDTNIEQ